MFKKILTISLTALFISACGGSSDSSSTDTTNGGNTGGTDGGGTDGGGTDGGDTDGGGGPIITGEAGEFADKGDSGNSVQGTYTLCPADVRSFSIFAQNGSEWCVPKCSADAEDGDGDGFGSIPAENGARYSCLVTPNTPGSQVQLWFSAPADGCPAPAGCPSGTFPAVFVTQNAGDNLAGTYSCADWLFDVNSQDWEQLATPAPFSLTLNADRSATISGTSTTWSFANGVLNLEGNRTFNNVAVGDGSFTEYKSNIAITRCK